MGLALKMLGHSMIGFPGPRREPSPRRIDIMREPVRKGQCEDPAYDPASRSQQIHRRTERDTSALNLAVTYCDDAACLPVWVQSSARQVQHPDWQARGVGQSAIIGKQVGVKVLGERHVHRVSEADVCP